VERLLKELMGILDGSAKKKTDGWRRKTQDKTRMSGPPKKS
jgi:hypothetical protein